MVLNLGEQFLIYDSKTQRDLLLSRRSPTRSPSRQQTQQYANERMLVFASPTALRMLGDHNHWAMDGTFKITPKIFRVSRSGQLYIVGIVIRQRTYPCIFALLTKQKHENFEELFTVIKRKISIQNLPSSVICDYDKAHIAAFKKIFPDARIQGII